MSCTDLADCLFGPWCLLMQRHLRLLHDFPHKREAVGVNAARRQRQHDVSLFDRGAVDDAVLLDRAHREAREVVLAGLVEAGHLGGLATQQRAIALVAALHDALDHRLRRVHVQLPGSIVVEEEERLRAGCDDVVDGHGDQVDTDRVVLVHVERELKLRAHAVGAGHQEGVAERNHAAKAADRWVELLNAVHQLVASVDVHSGLLVRQLFVRGGSGGDSGARCAAAAAAGGGGGVGQGVHGGGGRVADAGRHAQRADPITRGGHAATALSAHGAAAEGLHCCSRVGAAGAIGLALHPSIARRQGRWVGGARAVLGWVECGTKGGAKWGPNAELSAQRSATDREDVRSLGLD
eukprot:365268-Chlamydomonas_euryale.AAC.11